MSAINPDQLQAAEDFTQVLISRLATERGVHAETAISAASIMAGTFALASCGLPLTDFVPGTSLYSDLGDRKGQETLSIITETLALLNVPYDAASFDYQIPEANEPHLPLETVQRLLEEPYHAIVGRRRLTTDESAHAAALAVALLIQRCASVLDTRIGYTLAVYGIMEGCKTVPYQTAAA